VTTLLASSVRGRLLPLVAAQKKAVPMDVSYANVFAAQIPKPSRPVEDAMMYNEWCLGIFDGVCIYFACLYCMFILIHSLSLSFILSLSHLCSLSLIHSCSLSLIHVHSLSHSFMLSLSLIHALSLSLCCTTLILCGVDVCVRETDCDCVVLSRCRRRGAGVWRSSACGGARSDGGCRRRRAG